MNVSSYIAATPLALILFCLFLYTCVRLISAAWFRSKIEALSKRKEG